MLITAACGQHSGVYTGAGAASTDGSLGGGMMTVVDPETGRTVTVPVGDGSLTSTSTSGGPVAVQAPHASSDGDAVPPSERPARTIALEQAPVGGNTDGVNDSTIKIGIHVPLTGTATMPATATESFSLYWDHLCETRVLIAGRCVEIEWLNDNSDPTMARAACKELVEQDRVFMLMGIAGSHLVHACARYAATVGVPYFAGGTVEAAFAPLHTHFSMSMPHTRQAPLVADLLVDRLGARNVRNGMVRANMALTLEVEEALDREMAERGARFDVHSVVDPAYASTAAAEIESIVQRMKDNNVRNIYFGAGPMHFVHFLRSAASQGYRPQMVGSGPAWALEDFLTPACGNDDAAHGALAFNPWPSVGDHSRYDPAFARASGDGDLDWWMWGLMKTVGKLLAIPGRDLSRERLLWHTARASVASGVFPPVSFSPTDHFGGESMHLLRADCKRDDPAWVTDKAFVTP